jgi:hypothetical protein
MWSYTRSDTFILNDMQFVTQMLLVDQVVSYAHLTWYNLLLDSPHAQQQSVETFVAEEVTGDNVPSCLHYVLLS